MVTRSFARIMNNEIALIVVPSIMIAQFYLFMIYAEVEQFLSKHQYYIWSEFESKMVSLMLFEM